MTKVALPLASGSGPGSGPGSGSGSGSGVGNGGGAAMLQAADAAVLSQLSAALVAAVDKPGCRNSCVLVQRFIPACCELRLFIVDGSVRGRYCELQ